jgi:cell division initiation protein
MDSGQPPQQAILETLRTVEFRLGLKGYNVDEVDEYLEKAAVEAERLAEQLRQTVERLRQASERIAQLESAGPAPVVAPAPAPVAEAEVVPAPVDDSLQQTLLLAQRFVEQTKRESMAEANRLVSEAEERAHTLVTRAEDEAQQLVTDSQQRLREEVSRLEGIRAQLATDVENMARHLESERTRLRAMLSEVLKWIEENVQPAESLMAMRPRAVESSRAQPAGRLVAGDPPNESKSGADDEPGEDGDDGNVAQVLDLRSPNAAGAPPEGRA